VRLVQQPNQAGQRIQQTMVGSKTPAEIALSIMAEIVAVKNGIDQLEPTPVAAGKSSYESSCDQASATSSCGV